MELYMYFIHYTFNQHDGGQGDGNCSLRFGKIKGMDDVKRIERLIVDEDAKNKSVIITNWQRFEE